MAVQKKFALGRGLDALISNEEVKTSGSSSIILKMRSAPARAMMIELNCCATCMNGWVKLFVNCRYDAITPRVILPMLATERNTPNTAVSTNCRFPRFPMMGPITLANVCALDALVNSSSLSLSNSSSDICS